MLWPLIETWAALPRKGEAYLTEQRWFDLKETYAPGKPAEMAKDVAAFANSVGGALIVGAKEGPTQPDYSAPLVATYAEKVALEFDQAVCDYSRPSPTVHIRAIPSPDERGKVVLVVNIEPAVDQPIAVRHATDKDAWRFPIRVGRDTEFLFPEQLPLHMNSKARRAKLLLLRALAAGGDIDFYCVPSGGSTHNTMQAADRNLFKIEAVDAEGGGGVLLRDVNGHFGHQAIVVPLDDVEAVWLQRDRRWAMRISGRVEQVQWFDRDGDAAEKYELTYGPPSTFVVSPLGSLVQDLGKQVRDVARAVGGTLVVQHFQRQEAQRGRDPAGGPQALAHAREARPSGVAGGGLVGRAPLLAAPAPRQIRRTQPDWAMGRARSSPAAPKRACLCPSSVLPLPTSHRLAAPSAWPWELPARPRTSAPGRNPQSRKSAG